MLAPSPAKFNRAAIMRRAHDEFRHVAVSRAHAFRLIAENPHCGRYGGEVWLPPAMTFADALRFAWSEARTPNANDLWKLALSGYRAARAA
jgi:hypothetical protein